MAKISLTNIRNIFKTGLRPSQTQFWDTWDSFWHKDEKIQVEYIDGLNDLFVDINNHFNDPNAHEALLTQVHVYQFGKMQIFKAKTNFEVFLEVGDVASGWLADQVTFIPYGKYLGGDVQDIANWNTSPMNFGDENTASSNTLGIVTIGKITN